MPDGEEANRSKAANGFAGSAEGCRDGGGNDDNALGRCAEEGSTGDDESDAFDVTVKLIAKSLTAAEPAAPPPTAESVPSAVPPTLPLASD